MKRAFLSLAFAAMIAAGWSNEASARIFGRANHGSEPWHGNYYDPQWAGVPHAMVVPPTVHRQIKYGWGASGTEVQRIRHQYSGVGGADIGVSGGGMFQPQPVQPTHTDQFGTYYIRGPRK